MPAHLYLAPAGAGKTAYVLGLARQFAQGLAAQPRVVVASALQVRACRGRLAAAGGALGVQVLTFDRLYAGCLSAAGIPLALLSDPVEYRLVRAAVDALPLAYYAPLRDRPGFIQVLQRLMAEWKAAGISPAALAGAVLEVEAGPRLVEPAQVYEMYQKELRDHGWGDRAGMAWLALEAIRSGTATPSPWPFLAVDGFADFSSIQIDVLRSLVPHTANLVITLTAGDAEQSLVYRQFGAARDALQDALGIEAEPLPVEDCRRPNALAYLIKNLFRPGGGPAKRSSTEESAAAPALELVEAADREGEVRAALRWLKERILVDGMSAGQVALLARSMTAYRPFVLQIAAEYRLPVRLADGLPLSRNPAIVALLDLLRLALPAGAGPALPRRLVIEAWRSPYFDWTALDEGAATKEAGQASEAVEARNEREARTRRYANSLDELARWGRVIGGVDQWQEAFERLAAQAGGNVDEEWSLPSGLPTGPAAEELGRRFTRFLARVVPPPEATRLRDFVAWLEELIGPDPGQGAARFAGLDEPSPGGSLNVVCRAREGSPEVAEMDIAAMVALKDVLRGLVWAEETLGEMQARGIDFLRFFTELVGSIDAAVYHPPVYPGRQEVLVAGVAVARGLSFGAVALVGMAEGEFPAAMAEDPFLRESDRERLRALGLPLRSAIESHEAELFWETLARPSCRLMVTRPRLADNGAEWQASPFWEEIRQLSGIKPVTLAAGQLPPPGGAASWPELLESLAANEGYADLRRWAEEAEPVRCASAGAAARVFRHRQGQGAAGSFEGDLSQCAAAMEQRYGPARAWSASRLENYVGCPFRFFVGDVLGLEPRAEPGEGLEARQLGSIYHRIFAEVYTAAAPECSLEQVLAALPAVAKRVLDAAPDEEGFRATRWWAQTRQEIEGHVRKSLIELDRMRGDFVPVAFEVKFWEPYELLVTAGSGSFRMHGIIDRVDRAPDGRLRIIDYKTSGTADYPKTAFIDGKKLQLPLYALAAQEALGLGRATDGFYWHIQSAEPSKCTLSLTEGGFEDALEPARAAALAAILAIREGQFGPQPPEGGCPGYCPAATLCWHYQARFGD